MKAITSTTTAKTAVHVRATDKALSQWTKPLIGGIAMSLSFGLVTSGEAQAASFTFSRIATTDGFFRSFSDFVGVAPAINDSGTVAFKAFLSDEAFGPTRAQGIFTGSGRGTTTIDQDFSYEEAFSNPDINNEGTVAFSLSVYREPTTLYISSNGTLEPLFSTDDRFSSLSDPAINDGGTVAFRRSYDDYPYPQEIFTISNGSIRTIAVNNIVDSSSPFGFTEPSLPTFGSPDINNNDTVAFRANLVEGGSGIFTSRGSDITAIADTSGRFESFANPAINDLGTVVFSAELDGGGSGIFTASNADITTIADTSGLFSFFGIPASFGNFLTNPAINNNGNVAFLASLDAGGYGIFTGPNLVDKVIAIGDSLLDSTVTELFFSKEGLNNRGQIAFFARLADGTEGIFRANPMSEPPTSVPEPASILSLLGFAALGIGSLGKWQKK